MRKYIMKIVNKDGQEEELEFSADNMTLARAHAEHHCSVIGARLCLVWKV